MTVIRKDPFRIGRSGLSGRTGATDPEASPSPAASPSARANLVEVAVGRAEPAGRIRGLRHVCVLAAYLAEVAR
jgi:hypothetical protein